MRFWPFAGCSAKLMFESLEFSKGLTLKMTKTNKNFLLAFRKMNLRFLECRISNFDAINFQIGAR